MYGRELAYVALVVDDVEAASGVWEKNFGLRRSEHHMDGRKVPVLSVGKSAIALFGKGDPYTGGEMRTGVHHIALAVDDPEAAMHAVDKAGVRAESGKAEAALDNGKRYLLSMKATDGIRTYLSKRLDRPEAASGFIERVDHLGVVGTNNNQAIEVFCNALGCELRGEQFDTEMQVATEHFIYKTKDGTQAYMRTRPAEFVAAVHDLFIGTGDCELEIIQMLNTDANFRASADQPGNMKQDHGAIARYLERNGPGLHHIAFKVKDLDGHLGKFENSGFRLIDKQGRPGARGSQIGFLHPKSTAGVLAHFVERPE